MIGNTRAWIGAMALAALLALAAWGGFAAGAAQGERAAAAARERALEAEQAAANATLGRLQAAHARSDALSRQLATARRAASQLRKERDDALSRATTGRVCLDEPALRVLDGAPGITVDLPAPTGGAARADAAHAATDAHVAGWALDAGGQYDECRRRLDALIDWHEGAR